MNSQFKYVVTTKSRHGTTVRYYWPRGQAKIRLRAEPGTNDFLREYLAAKNGAPPPVIAGTPMAGTIKPGSLRWLVSRYYASPAFKLLNPHTAGQRRVYLDGICRSLHPESQQARGSLAFAGMKRTNVIALRDSISEAPCAANAHVGALRILFNWAIENEIATYNPAFRVEQMPWSRDGHHTWTDDECMRFEKHHPVGTVARLAFAIMAYTGVRRSDVIRLGPQNVRAGVLHFTEFKGSKSKAMGKFRAKPKARTIPIVGELQTIIDATPSGSLVFLLNKRGGSFGTSTFGRQFREWCDEAGLPHCTAHGVRKSAATTIADRGGTAHQLRAFGGWSNLKQVERYTARADDTKLTAQAVQLLRSRQD